MNADSHRPEAMEWRCLRAKPKCEHLAARHVIALAPGEIDTFCPRLRHRKKTARGPVWFTEALFPGYLFTRCDWPLWQRAILATTGVTGQVHFGITVPTIPPQVIADLRAAIPDDEPLAVQIPLATGDEVEIGDGPLRGATGTVTRVMPARERVAVLLEFLGGTREIEVPLLSVLGLRDIREGTIA
jgi:transcriptional antiterminator RfaH